MYDQALRASIIRLPDDVLLLVAHFFRFHRTLPYCSLHGNRKHRRVGFLSIVNEFWYSLEIVYTSIIERVLFPLKLAVKPKVKKFSSRVWLSFAPFFVLFLHLQLYRIFPSPFFHFFPVLFMNFFLSKSDFVVHLERLSRFYIANLFRVHLQISFGSDFSSFLHIDDTIESKLKNKNAG